MPVKPPHILLASGNVQKLKSNLAGVLPLSSLDLINNEINDNVLLLFKLGYSQFTFAKGLNNRAWRQKVSRYYYACYNICRSIRLYVNGDFGTDVTDHKKISDLPNDFPKKSVYVTKLVSLRDDRNMADYDHTGKIGDLLLTVSEIEDLTVDFISDAKGYLISKGLTF